jgi:hypothetical protein
MSSEISGIGMIRSVWTLMEQDQDAIKLSLLVGQRYEHEVDQASILAKSLSYYDAIFMQLISIYTIEAPVFGRGVGGVREKACDNIRLDKIRKAV